MNKVSEMTNQEVKTQGTKYQVLQNFGICCRREVGAQSYEFSCMHARFLLFRCNSVLYIASANSLVRQGT